MCGIAGKIRFDNVPVPENIVEAMNERIRHRGPDDGSVWSAPGGVMGHRRLSIRDLSPIGRQPMTDADGRIAVSFNGEIYNYKYLRKAIEDELGLVFRSHCDTEVLPYGFLLWGERLFDFVPACSGRST